MFSFVFGQVQYKQMVECIRGLDDIAKYRRFRLLRPDQSVHESPRAWWIYAGRCHGLKLEQRHRTHEITKENLRYLELYTKLIVNPNETLTNEQKEFKDRLEKDRAYYELKFLREVNVLIAWPFRDGLTQCFPFFYRFA